MKTNFLRKGSMLILEAFLFNAMQIGCTYLGDYSESDTLCPDVDVRGKWLLDDGSQKSTYEINDGHVVESDNLPFHYSVKGRVVRMKKPNAVTFYIVSPEGRQMTLNAGKVWRYCRINLEKPSQQPEFAKEALLDGLVFCQLPVDKNGLVHNTHAEACAVRPVLAGYACITGLKGDVEPRFLAIPCEPPGRLSIFNYPGMSKPFVSEEVLKETRSAYLSDNKQAITIAGEKYWYVLSPFWDDDSSEAAPRMVVAEIYQAEPTIKKMPLEIVPVARRLPGKPWRSVGSYFMSASRLARVCAVLDKGIPSKLDSREMNTPLLEDLLEAKDDSIPVAQWKARQIIDFKNKALPGILKEAKSSDLKTRISDIEKAVLDISRESELAKDTAEDLVRAGSNHEAEKRRELSLTLRERVDVLKAVLRALKDEVSLREK